MSRDEASILSTSADVNTFLAESGGRYCVSLPGRGQAVRAFADAVAGRRGSGPEASPEQTRLHEEAVERMLLSGDIVLEEENRPGGAYWAFTSGRAS